MYKTGETVPEDGRYVFVIYVEKVPDLKLPLPDEHHIELQAGEKFPPVQSNGREAYWRKA